MIAVYPGSFDPPTNGHLDIIKRASKLTDHLIVAVLNNSSKHAFFTLEERLEQLTLITQDMHNVEVAVFSGLLVDFVEEVHARLIIRGLRAVTDFEYEFQMALTNRKLHEKADTVFLPTSREYMYLSSSIVKEIAKYHGNIDDMVPPCTKQFILEKFHGRDSDGINHEPY